MNHYSSRFNAHSIILLTYHFLAISQGFNYAAANTSPMGNNTGGGGGFGMVGGGGGGGGGNNTLTPPSSRGSSSGGKRSYADQTLIPCTIRMILKAMTHNTPGGGSGTDDTMLLQDQRPISTVKIIGAVRTVTEQSTNVMYEIEDGTGLLEVKHWIDQNDNSAITQMRMQVCVCLLLYLLFCCFFILLLDLYNFISNFCFSFLSA